MNASVRSGFTLVEVLITLVLTGIMMSAIYQLYLNTQSVALGQEEVVELQQNLRIAMDRLARDIRMAGFLVSNTHPPLRSAPRSPTVAEPLELYSACPRGRGAQLGAGIRVRNTLAATFPLISPEMVELFAVNDRVRLIRPLDQSQPLDRLLRVAGRDAQAGRLTLEGFEATDAAEYWPGDALVLANATYPGVIAYYLKDHELFVRHSDGNAQRLTAKKQVGANLVTGLTSFELAYVMDDGRRLDTAPPDELTAVQAVQVSLSGQARTSQGVKVRGLRSLIALRNR